MAGGQKVRLSQFAAYLEVPASDTLDAMFSLFDEVALSPSRGLGGKTFGFSSINCFPYNRHSVDNFGSKGGKPPHLAPRTSPPCLLGDFLPCF